MKRALVVGIDRYPDQPLTGCENDARDIARLLERNGDGSPNFAVRLLSSETDTVDAEALSDAVAELFASDAETAVFYFAGHGVINPETNAGYIVSQDGRRGAWGMSLSEVIGLANGAYPRVRSTVIVLDSCHSGYAGEVAGLGRTDAAIIGNGVTILTATHREGTAAESGGRGVFTDILVDGLSGAACDIRGKVSPAALYSHVDQTLGPWEQRPMYKANVRSFITLRQVAPKVPDEILRLLPVYFPDAAYHFPLDPSYEPDRQNIPEQFRHLPVDEDHTRIFKQLQLCNRHGLVVPVGEEYMYYAAINSTACKLTASGAHYRRLAVLGRI
jgi:hypothetical protein